MTDYYCPNCATMNGLKSGIDTSDVLGTSYQQGKHRKHTVPSTSHPVQSVFDSSSTQYYEDCIQEAIFKGFVEIDDHGRKNVLFCPSTGGDVGSKYKWGKLATRVDTVVVVNTSAPSEIHPFLTNSSHFSTQACEKYGGSLL